MPAEACGTPSDEGKLTVAWHEEDSDPPQATAEIGRVRPAAPAVPPGWAANLKAGETIDVFHDGCWWEVILESRKGGKAKVADGPDDPLPREVRLSQLRPRYTWLGWAGGWKYLTEGREVRALFLAQSRNRAAPRQRAQALHPPSSRSVVA